MLKHIGKSLAVSVVWVVCGYLEYVDKVNGSLLLALLATGIIYSMD